MARIVSPGTSRSDGYGARRPSTPFFVTDLVRRYGVRAILAIIVAAMFAFAPLATLYWFNNLRLQSVISVSPDQRFVVKSGQRHEEQEKQEPGETSLLQITCVVPHFEEWQELLGYDDPAAPRAEFRSCYVNRERVFLRRAGSALLPFGLLGPPPVSVWLPSGDYEILVVHEAPKQDPRFHIPGKSFPLLSVFADCTLESRQKTVVRIPLPHYASGNPDVQLGIQNHDPSDDGQPTSTELTELISDCESQLAIPTPSGYVLNLHEPRIHHDDGHHGCVQDFEDFQPVLREWTRDQLATLRWWLPKDAVMAQTRLATLVDRLQWREFLEGWFCYALAGTAGLVFTRCGAIALLEPWRRDTSLSGTIWLIVRIVMVSVLASIVLQIVSNVFGWQSLGPFRSN